MKYLLLTFRILLFFLLVGLLSSAWTALFLCLPFPEGGTASAFLSSLSLLGAVLTASTLLMRLWEHVPFRAVGFPRDGWGKEVFGGTLMALGIYSAGFFFSLLSGAVTVTAFRFRLADLALSWLLMLLIALGEEVMMRGFVLGSLLRAGVGRYRSLFLSSLIFALLHAANPGLTFLSFANILLAGFLLGSTYIYTRSLWYPVALHLFWNWLQGPVLGYEVSGNVFGSSMLTLQRSGAAWLHGGSFGFEGSLLCTLLLLISIGLHLHRFRFG